MYTLAPLALALLATTLVAADPQATPQAGSTPTTLPSVAYGKPIKTDINPGQMITYPSVNTDVQAYYVTPKLAPTATPAPADPNAAPPPAGDTPSTEAPKMPAIIYIHDIFGMTDFAKKQADDLARQGYAVLMPNLYTRIDNTAKGLSAQEAWIAYEKTADPQVKQDLQAAIEFLNIEGKPTADQPLAVVGHDMGGIFAMLLASSDLRVTAAVNYYGRIVYPNITPARPNSPVEDLFNLRAPILSFYGSNDPQTPNEQIKALESRLSNSPNHPYFEVVKLPGVGHGFMVPGRQGFNAQAASSSEEKTRNFLARYLRAEPKKAEE